MDRDHGVRTAVPSVAPGLAAILLAAVLAGCVPGTSGPGTSNPASDELRSPGTAEGPASAQLPATGETGKCTRVRLPMLEAITLAAHDYAMMPVRGATMEQVGPEGYLIAMEFVPDDRDALTGIWAADSLNPREAQIVAVDRVAREYTVWPAAEEGALPAVPSVDRVRKIRACLAD